MKKSGGLSVPQFCALYILYIVYFAGVWTGFPLLGKTFSALFALAGIVLASLRHPKWELGWTPSSAKDRLDKLSAGLVAVVVLPALVYLLLTWNQEFPFVGDHDHHLWTGIAVSHFWNRFAWFGLFHFLAGRWVISRGYARAWIIVGYLGTVTLGFLVPETGFFHRYPGLSYFFTWPWMSMALGLGTRAPLNAHRFSQLWSIVMWVAFLRPYFLGKRPSVAVLLFGIFFFWQKDIIYYFTAAYLEPWALIFILVGFEHLFTKGINPWLGCLWIGLASLVKEQAIFMLPFYAAACAWENRQDLAKRSTWWILVSSGIPFVTYYLYRRACGVWRVAKIASLSQISSAARFEEFTQRLFLQWNLSGLILGGILILIILAYLRAQPKLRMRGAIFLSATAFSVGFFYVDLISLYWTGYPRFQLMAYASFFVWLIPVGEALRGKRALPVLLVLSALGNAIPFYEACRITFKPDAYRNFSEHYDAPIYLDIRRLVRLLEKEHGLNDVRALRVADRIHSYSFGALPVGYADLARQFRLAAEKDDPTVACRCRSSEEAILYPAKLYVGLGRVNGGELAAEPERIARCRSEMNRTCGRVFVDEYRGDVLGLVGIAPNDATNPLKDKGVRRESPGRRH